MATITQPRTQIPIGEVLIGGKAVPVQIHPEYLRFFTSLVNRAGGTVGSGTQDLDVSQFDDAGIQEMQAQQFADRDAADQSPALALMPAEADQSNEVAALREHVARLERMVLGLAQGSIQ
jgi:hypothetical protein